LAPIIAWPRRVLVVLLASACAGNWPVAAQSPLCTVASGLSALPGVGEASGVAVSRRTPGIIWSHNDSDLPTLLAFDATGTARGRVRVTGASVTDWEDLAAGPCPVGACLYIADIGDNNRSRGQITIYRVPEPRPDDEATLPADVWTATYPDGARDAEALIVTPAGEVFLVTKENQRTTALYRVPVTAPAAVARLELVSPLAVARVTGGGVSGDGNWVALRTNTTLLFYPAADLLTGKNPQPRQFDLRPLKERQGEGVAFGQDGLIFLAGEGSSTRGTLAAVRCSPR
jgi:hypothetical protein